LAAAVGGDYTGTNPTDVSATNTDNDDPVVVVVVVGGGGGGAIPPPIVTPGLVDTSAACPESISLSGFGDVVGFDVMTVQAIDCIVHYGISNGTSDLTFNPTGPVSRWQMALFLIRQAQVHGVGLPAATDHGFTDIAGYNLAIRDAINQLAQLGITRGAGMGIFSPSDSMSRWEMALFLIRFASVVGIPPSESVGSAGFTDMGSFNEETRAAVDQLVQYGIAAGTSSSTFEPAGHVLRWQMALFLTRMLARDGIVPS
jgi:S-layer family protein